MMQITYLIIILYMYELVNGIKTIYAYLFLN